MNDLVPLELQRDTNFHCTSYMRSVLEQLLSLPVSIVLPVNAMLTYEGTKGIVIGVLLGAYDSGCIKWPLWAIALEK